MSTRAPWRARSWRRVRRYGVSSWSRVHERVEVRELVRLERIEALLGQALLVAGHGHRDLDLAALAATRETATCRADPARRRRAAIVGRLVAAAPSRSRGTRPRTPRRRRAPAAGSVTTIARGVQYSRRRATGRTSSSARASSAERAGVIGSPASCSRRAKAPTVAGRSSQTRLDLHRLPHELLEAGRADHLLVLAVLEHRAERAVDRRRVEGVDAEQVERGQPVDRLGDAGRLLHVAVAHARHRGRPPARPAPPRRPSRGGG